MENKLLKNIEKLALIQELKLGDDENITFSNDFIHKIKKICQDLEYQPEIFPNYHGNIQLEYEENEKYLEFEIMPTMKMNIFKIDEDGTEHENNNIDCTIENIIQEVDWFFQ